MIKSPLDPQFLPRIEWVHVTLHFEVAGQVLFPAYPGSTLRGALGHLLRPALCEERPPCADNCRAPERCGYFSLFEGGQNQQGGRDAPKPMILVSPLPEEMEAIGYGAPVTAPYQVEPPSGVNHPPRLLNEHSWAAPPGAPISFGLKVLGGVSAVIPPLIQFLSGHPLTVPGGRLLLRRAEDTLLPGRVLWDARVPRSMVEPPTMRALSQDAGRWRSVRLIFRTPVLLKQGNSTCFAPESLAQLVLQQSVVRAAQVHDALFRPDGGRLPFFELPPDPVLLAGSRLFRYVLPRISFRQDRWMNFDGVVGWLDLEGELAPFAPFLRAAEVLHLGQKTTFGLGAVTCIPLE